VTDRLQAEIGATVAGLGYELLGIERGLAQGAQLFRLYIDREQGIGVDDCERVSRQVEDMLEAEGLIRGEYTLEVSSPGLDRPLFTLEQHRRFVGAEIVLRLRLPRDGRRRLQGVLCEVGESSLTIELAGERIALGMSEIERSRLIPDWSAAFSRRPKRD
jgi:ribosome maturation factor RimP